MFSGETWRCRIIAFVDRSVVTIHLRNIFESKELSESAVCAEFEQTADEGKTYHYKFYSFSAIIAVGYRTNSIRETQFSPVGDKGVGYLFETKGMFLLFRCCTY